MVWAGRETSNTRSNAVSSSLVICCLPLHCVSKLFQAKRKRKAGQSLGCTGPRPMRSFPSTFARAFCCPENLFGRRPPLTFHPRSDKDNFQQNPPQTPNLSDTDHNKRKNTTFCSWEIYLGKKRTEPSMQMALRYPAR